MKHRAKDRASVFISGYWVVTGVLFVAGVAMLVFYTPAEETMGVVQKMFYIHFPVAMSMFASAFILFIASVGYLWDRSLVWDDLAGAAGKITVLFCSTLLLTGMIWGKSAWGQWWTWSPRLTFSLVLWMLYVVYVLIRPAIKSSVRRATVSAVYGMVAFLDVPLVYVSVELLPDIHPSSIELTPPMRLTLLAWTVLIPLLMIGLLVTRFNLNRRLRALEATHEASGPNRSWAEERS